MSCIGRLILPLVLSPILVFSVAASAFAQSPAGVKEPAGPDMATMAARIDKLLAESWTKEEVEPAPLADDAEFLRRESRPGGRDSHRRRSGSFVADPSADKRSRLIDRLLASHLCADHLATTWPT